MNQQTIVLKYTRRRVWVFQCAAHAFACLFNFCLDALTKEGCEKIFQEKVSGAQQDRPELKAALGLHAQGDTLVVWKIDRLARSMKQLIEMIESFQDRGIGLKSLQDPIDYQFTQRETRLPYLCGTSRIRTWRHP